MRVDTKCVSIDTFPKLVWRKTRSSKPGWYMWTAIFPIFCQYMHCSGIDCSIQREVEDSLQCHLSKYSHQIICSFCESARLFSCGIHEDYKTWTGVRQKDQMTALSNIGIIPRLHCINILSGIKHINIKCIRSQYISGANKSLIYFLMTMVAVKSGWIRS